MQRCPQCYHDVHITQLFLQYDLASISHQCKRHAKKSHDFFLNYRVANDESVTKIVYEKLAIQKRGTGDSVYLICLLRHLY
jgi:hypothetical protein